MPIRRLIALQASTTAGLLDDRKRLGVILQGPYEAAGIIDAIVTSLPRSEFWFVAGSPDREGPRFRALSPYLELYQQQESLSAITVLRALRRRLHQSGRRVIVVVEEPGNLDLGSAELLATVAEEGLVQLLIMHGGPEPLLPEFLALLRSDSLVTLEMGHSSAWELVAELQQTLGGIVPWAVGHTVQVWTGGIESWVYPCVAGAIASGELFQTEPDGVWRLGAPRVLTLEEEGLDFSHLMVRRIEAIPSKARQAYECVALAGAVSARHLTVLFGKETVTELIGLESIKSSPGLACDCLWVGASRVADAILARIRPATLEWVTERAEELAASRGCFAHGRTVRPDTWTVPGTGADLAAGVDLMHGTRALIRGDWTSAVERGTAAGNILRVDPTGHPMSWMRAAADFLREPLTWVREEYDQGGVIRSSRFFYPEVEHAMVAVALAAGVPGVEHHAIAGHPPEERRALSPALGRAVLREDRVGCLTLAREADAAGDNVLAYAARCSAARLCVDSPVLLWRIAEEFDEYHAGFPLPSGIASLIKQARIRSREAETIRAVLAGGTTTEVAEQLGLSPRTVDWYLGRALTKFQLKSRDALREAYWPS